MAEKSEQTTARHKNFYVKYRSIILKALFQGIINKDTWNYLDTKDPRIPTFYTLPKTHKSLTEPPSHPIISGCSSLTENASSLIDNYLSPHVTSLSSYVKDSIDLLKKIEGIFLPVNTWLIALEIESLYNTIPHKKGLDVIQSFVAERGHSAIALDILGYILQHNVFLFFFFT